MSLHATISPSLLNSGTDDAPGGIRDDQPLTNDAIDAACARGRFDMLTFEVFIDDDRYSVPTLVLINAEDDARACSKAESLLRESPHHRGVELRLEGARVFGAGSYADPAPTD